MVGEATEVMRAYRVGLDPTDAQLIQLFKHAGASRAAFNHAIAVKRRAHQVWREEVAWATYGSLGHLKPGEAEEAARKIVKVAIPYRPEIQKVWNVGKGDSRKGVDGTHPWWHEVSTYAFQSAFLDADAAWSNWVSSLRGSRRGRRIGYPRFKRKHDNRHSFRLHHNVKTPTIRPDGYRRLVVPRIGSIRLHGNVRHLARRIRRGTVVVQSITISRGGSRWHASILVKQQTYLPARATPRQASAGTVGVDLGVHHLAALSDGTLIPNPRHVRVASRKLRRAQQALARTGRGSAGRHEARKRVAKFHHQLAERRQGALHQITKSLATNWAAIAIEDLNVAGMTSSAKGTQDKPGTNVRAKAGLNRSILDASFGEFRRQLTYKTTWYGSTLHVTDRWAPTSKTCSTCGTVKSKQLLSQRQYECETCGLTIDRDVNAALNIAALAASPELTVASNVEETQNASRERVSPGPPGSAQ